MIICYHINMKILKNKLIYIILFLVVISALVTYFLLFNKKELIIDFSLIGDKYVTINYGEEYSEEGYELIVNGNKETNINIINNIDYSRLGEYKIIYKYIDDYKEEHELNRIIKIVDNELPIITLEGNLEESIIEGEEYKEKGYNAIDNYDGDITDKVIIDNKVNNKKSGNYEIKYTVSDSSNNSYEIIRKVIVTKPKTVITKTETKSDEKKTNTEEIKKTYPNTITKNEFNNTGIYYEGHLEGNNGIIKILLKSNDNNISFDMLVNGDNYSGVIDISKVPNGNYEVYLASTNEEKLVNKMELIDRIVRSKVNDKLVSVNYDSDNVNIKVEDFNYEYDVLIDVGHGGNDIGSSNKYIYEKDMNLTVSLYEKCRYEEHGLKVYINRTTDTYGPLMGDTSWNQLSRRAYLLGYYGVVSRVSYSNHHNSTVSSKASGYEILTPAHYDSLEHELNIINEFNKIYTLKENHPRMYTRNYDTGEILSTIDGKKYDIKDYYCIIRIPYLLFNTKMVIYEPIYISNNNDYEWYWVNNNWKTISEIKIKEYLKELNVSYNEETSCK